MSVEAEQDSDVPFLESAPAAKGIPLSFGEKCENTGQFGDRSDIPVVAGTNRSEGAGSRGPSLPKHLSSRQELEHN